MPTSARKSSLGAARRGTQKAHIPYRGDNPEVGKKTGIAVQHVERKSDGFEPFEEIMQQADNRTPPRPKGRKKKQSMAIIEDELDEYGEMSMELDDSPMQYFTNSRPPATPQNLSRNVSTSRPVARTSEIDFDKVPSPRPRGSIRKSLPQASVAGPSRLSKSFNVRDLEQESDPSDNDYDAPENDHYNGSPEPYVPQGTSFVQMDQDDDEDQEAGDYVEQQEEEFEQEPLLPPPPQKRDKGKGRTSLPEVPEELESDIEGDIAEGLEDVEQQHYSDDDQQAEEPHPEPEPRRTKKAKFDVEEVTKPRVQPRSKSRKENRPIREGVRKSAREHYKPLEWWRGEKLVYGRSRNAGNGAILVPPIKEIVRIPKEQPEPLGKRKRAITRARSKSKATEEAQIVIPAENPEEGWDDDTQPQCVVLDFPSKKEILRRVAHTAKMLSPKKVATDGWSFQKVFGDADFIAAGVLVIPPGGRKPTKRTKDNTYIFYVIEGAVNFKIHETSLILATGAMFIVPRGNIYFIENIAERDAKIFFTQARKVPREEDQTDLTNPASGPRSSMEGRGATQLRSSSATVTGGATRRPLSTVPASKRAVSTRA